MDAAPDTNLVAYTHRALRTSADRLVAVLGEIGPTDRKRVRALARWYEGFAGELSCHHQIEDEISFPALAARVPTYCEHAPELADDHARIHRLLDQLQADFACLVAGAPHVDATRHHATELRDLLHRHLDHEDADVIPLFARHFGAEELEVLDRRAIRRIPARQLLFTAPWLMSHLDPAEAREVVDAAPTPVVWLWKATRGRHARLVARSLGPAVAIS